jgi:AmmeMemoRadiSam system protein B/AmmeMemoRadiSam system protein A
MGAGRKYTPRRIPLWFLFVLAATGIVLEATTVMPLAGRGSVRRAAIAGSWYPGRRCIVSAEVDRMLRAASGAPALGGQPVALVVPHAGWRFSGVAAAAAFRNLRPGDFDRVVVMAPSHRGQFEGFSIPEVSAYRTPVGDAPLCEEAVKKLKDGKLVRTVAGVHRKEHSIEIELPFLQERLDSFCLVPILTGRTDAAMKKTLAKRLSTLHDGRTLFVFSSDFTHYGPRYGYQPFGRSALELRQEIGDLDARALGYLSPPDAAGFQAFLEETSDTICGREGLGVMLELLPIIAPEAKAVELAQYASIDIPGFQDDNSVSYASIAYVEGDVPKGRPLGAPPPPPACPLGVPPLEADLGRKLLRVARATLNTELAGSDDLRRALRDLPSSGRAEMERLQAAFVTLHRTDPEEIKRKGRMRGCVGQVVPTYPLPEAVVIAAASAALEDARFPPVRREELSRLEIELTVLSPPRPVDSWKKIRLGRDGIVLQKNGQRAVFLPHVPLEQGWGLEETLTHLARKAGLSANAWRAGASFEVFDGQKFSEEDI